MRELTGLPTCSELHLKDAFEISGDGISNITILLGPTKNSVVVINGNAFPIKYQMCFNGVCSIDTTLNGVMEANSAKLLTTSSSINAWKPVLGSHHLFYTEKINSTSAGNVLGVDTWLDQDLRSKVCPTTITGSHTYSQMRSLLNKFPLLRVNGFKCPKILWISAALTDKECTLNGIMIQSFTPLFFGWAANGSDGTYCIAGIDATSGACYWKQKS